MVLDINSDKHKLNKDIYDLYEEYYQGPWIKAYEDGIIPNRFIKQQFNQLNEVKK